MSDMDFTSRARNALLGLAIGDAIGWPAMHHRSRLLPPWTRRLRREIDAQREEAGVIRVPLPFSLNRPSEALRPGPTDDTEWAAWMIDRLLQTDLLVTAESVERDWTELARQEGRILGGVSTRTALDSLRKGIFPPASGRENPHYFDDGAMCRAVPVGLAHAGRPDAAIRAAEQEAAATNAEDGIWTAAAVAAAISVASVGADKNETLEAAGRALPSESWGRRVVDEALTIARTTQARVDLIVRLQSVASVEYNDGCAGPESLAMILAIVSREGENVEQALLLANALPRSADVAPAIVGAICGALAGEPLTAPGWVEELRILRGICIPGLEGREYFPLIERFIAACARQVPAGGDR